MIVAGDITFGSAETGWLPNQTWNACVRMVKEGYSPSGVVQAVSSLPFGLQTALRMYWNDQKSQVRYNITAPEVIFIMALQDSDHNNVWRTPEIIGTSAVDLLRSMMEIKYLPGALPHLSAEDRCHGITAIVDRALPKRTW